jgi:DNA-binding beta-propeller fold protein YncE
MRTVQVAKLLGSTVLVAAAWTSPAFAVTAEITTKDASLVGDGFSFSATTTDVVGVALYRWSFGDDVKTDYTAGQSQVEHVYAKPGHYTVSVTVKDDSSTFGGDTFTHIVHYPVTEKRPTASSTIVYDAARNRIFNVNQDNDSISAIDPMALTKTGELAVYQDPEALALAPNGKLWVLHKDDYAIAVVDPDTLQIERGFRLPYASQPIGLVMSPSGDAAYVTLMAVGKLLKLDPASGEVLGELAVGPSPRGVSVSGDGSRVFVTRFVSATTGGEVVEVDAATLTEKNRFLLTPDTTTMDTDQKGRGLPNFLFSVGLTPDAREAWISGKKDNIFRGVVRDGQKLSQDNTVRPMISVLDLSQTTESQANRIDLDDRDLPTYVEFSPLGDYAFVTVTGSNMVEVRDSYTKGFVTALTDAGLAPRGTVLGPKGQLFVQGSMERSIAVYDVSTILDSSDIRSKKVMDIPVVATEKLLPDVLLGKQVFSNSADGRMTVQGYLTCITCHFDGGDDGQVYDFTSRGEGFRNTISLRGRRGSGQGNLLWSGAFDEVQDFEEEIRGLFLGHGFIADDELAKGTRADALGESKKGLSKELDALAAYLTTLDHVNPSPFRNKDGTMTADGEAGKALFGKLGCDFCHSGSDYTDSARRRLHDVGTLTPNSGTRGGKPLLGLDTPSLLGAWETAPYLHDGSAATLRDVLTSANPNDQHGFVSSLSAQQLDQLVAFLQQLDGDQKLRALPFEPPLPEGGAGGVGGSSGGGGDVSMPPTSGSGGTPNAAGSGTGPTKKHDSSCAVSTQSGPNAFAWLTLLPLAVWYRRRQRRALWAGGEA